MRSTHEWQWGKPADPTGCEYLNGRWWLPLQVLPPEQRVMPQTISDVAMRTHKLKCLCYNCNIPGTGKAWKHRDKIQRNRDKRAAQTLSTTSSGF